MSMLSNTKQQNIEDQQQQLEILKKQISIFDTNNTNNTIYNYSLCTRQCLFEKDQILFFLKQTTQMKNTSIGYYKYEKQNINQLFTTIKPNQEIEMSSLANLVVLIKSQEIVVSFKPECNLKDWNIRFREGIFKQWKKILKQKYLKCNKIEAHSSDDESDEDDKLYYSNLDINLENNLKMAQNLTLRQIARLLTEKNQTIIKMKAKARTNKSEMKKIIKALMEENQLLRETNHLPGQKQIYDLIHQ